MKQKEIEKKVIEITMRVAQEKSLDPGEIKPRMRFIQDVGLKSLDMARIIALLEAEYPYDPFAELVPITSIRTIDDLAGAYFQAWEADGANAS